MRIRLELIRIRISWLWRIRLQFGYPDCGFVSLHKVPKNKKSEGRIRVPLHTDSTSTEHGSVSSESEFVSPDFDAKTPKNSECRIRVGVNQIRPSLNWIRVRGNRICVFT
jgi:hypothetical protein